MKNKGLDVSIFDRSALHEARKKVLLQVAGNQFTQNGFGGTSIESVAQELNLTKAGLYHYVSSKEELLYLCYKNAIESAERCMEKAENLNCSAPEKITAYIKEHLLTFDQNRGSFIILSEFYSLNKEHQKELKERAKLVDRHMKKLLEDGISEGSINPCDTSLVVFAIQGALNWIPKWYSPEGKYDVAKIATSFSDFFKTGLNIR